MAFTDSPNELVIPSSAGPDDLRIVRSDDDPLLVGIGRPAGDTYYFHDGKAFVVSVSRDGSGNRGVYNIDYAERAVDGTFHITRSIFSLFVDPAGMALSSASFNNLDEVDINTPLALNGKIVEVVGTTLNEVPAASFTGPSNTTYTDLGTHSVTFTKRNNAATDLKFVLALSAWTPTAQTKFTIGLNVNGTDYDIIPQWKMNLANTHLFASGVVRVPNLLAGSYTIKPRYARLATTAGTFNHDVEDSFSLDVSEVAVG